MSLTTSQVNQQLKTLEKLLNLPLVDTMGAGGTFKLNETQEVFIRLYGAGGGKGYACINPAAKYRRGSDSPYFNRNETQIGIHFAEGKAPEKIAQDVTRRLLNSPERANIEEETNAAISRFNASKNREKNLAEQLAKIGLSVSDSNKAYYNENGLYIDLRFEGGNAYFDRFSIDKAKISEVIEALIQIHSKK